MGDWTPAPVRRLALDGEELGARAACVPALHPAGGGHRSGAALKLKILYMDERKKSISAGGTGFPSEHRMEGEEGVK